MKAGLVAAASVALVGLTACGASRASSPAPGNADVDVRDAYLASIHRGAWFDGSDDDTLLRIGSAVCTNLDHDSSVEHIVRMAAANHIPPKQARELVRAAVTLCPQHQGAVGAHYTACALHHRAARSCPDARPRNRSGARQPGDPIPIAATP